LLFFCGREQDWHLNLTKEIVVFTAPTQPFPVLQFNKTKGVANLIFVFEHRLHQLFYIFVTMKFLAFILSLYIFTLNLGPCEDNCMLDNEVKTEVSQAMGDNHQHQGSDLCSPFCNCHCCHIYATHFKVLGFTVAVTEISTDVFYHFDGLEKDFNPIILQPPQV